METNTVHSSRLRHNLLISVSKELHELHAMAKMLTGPSPPSVIYGSWERSGEKSKNKDVQSQSQRATEGFNEER